jgi:farnesol dehydrogenase
MRVLVTGGTGFFGKSLVRALAARGDEVAVLARGSSDVSGLDLPRVRIARGDVEDASAVRAALEGADVLFHGAAVVKELVKDRTIFDRVNVDALVSTLAAARAAGVRRVVYTSSFFAIGPSDRAKDRTADETFVREPRYCTDYERTKFLAEAKVAAEVERGLDVVSVLPGFITGPGDMTEGNLIVRTLLDLEEGRLPALPGGGAKKWCLAFVDDVVRGHLLALEKGRKGERYLIGGDNPTLREILDEYHRLGGRKPPALSLPFGVTDFAGALDEFVRWKLLGRQPMLSRGKACAARHDWAYSSAKARRELGYEWRPWRDVLAATVAWMKDRGLVGKRG